MINTLVINFPALMNGGIENICYELMKYSISQGYRVIWLYRNPQKISSAFETFVERYIETIEVHRNALGQWKHKELSFKKDEKVTILSFTPFDMDNALKLTEEYSQIDITPLYLVANTKGRYYFVEEYYFGKIQKFLFKKTQVIMQNWAEMDAVRFCAERQCIAFEQHYKVIIKNHKNKILKEIFPPQSLDEDALYQRSDRSNFNLVTITRFDFPHKGYLLGLIRAYGHLKEKYPNLYLHIIGYGQGLSQVKAEINKLPYTAQQDVKLYGEMSLEEISKVLNNMHLNISVAGSVGVGASCGVLSIPARNFCEDDCEVYGFLPASRAMATATQKGEPVEPYIENVIHMSKDEYVRRCRDSYKTYAEADVDPEYIFSQKICKSVNPLNKHIFFDIVYIFRDYAYKIRTLLKKE